ncbi:hypothetical protein [Leptolyngbya sp. 7M]|uniref:hypothetical protein n=1 Tax=Leptolyngbya sp. 7M TaxID=2812896 RepID=UPI001B8B9DEA|nr:hypothetical protein [Leptolyngbya sp. 7M]QYO64123.1 hypothetical protein JVX88_30915 [Leptolyngbya sp. 7M]
MPFHLFPLAAEDQASLLDQLRALEQTVTASTSLHQTASQTFASFQQQTGAKYVATIVGHSQEEVLQEIQRGLKGIERAFQQNREWQTPAGSYFTPAPQGKLGKVAFVYPGAFMSYMGMGRDVFRLFPKLHGHAFEDSTRLNQLLYEQSKRLYPRTLSKPMTRQLEALEAEFSKDSEVMLIAGTVAAIQATSVLRNYFNLQPQAAFGYSLGELSMLFSLGLWSDIDTISDQMSTSELFKTRLAGPKTAILEHWGLPADAANAQSDFWGSYILLTSVDKVREAIQKESRVYLTHVNTPQEVMIGGDKAACLRLIESLQCDYFPLEISGILHCDPVRLEFNQLQSWAKLPVQSQDVNLYTAAHYGKPAQLDSETIADHVATALSQCCDFPRLINTVYDEGARIFVEIGPGGSCSRVRPHRSARVGVTDQLRHARAVRHRVAPLGQAHHLVPAPEPQRLAQRRAVPVLAHRHHASHVLRRLRDADQVRRAELLHLVAHDHHGARGRIIKIDREVALAGRVLVRPVEDHVLLDPHRVHFRVDHHRAVVPAERAVRDDVPDDLDAAALGRRDPPPQRLPVAVVARLQQHVVHEPRRVRHRRVRDPRRHVLRARHRQVVLHQAAGADREVRPTRVPSDVPADDRPLRVVLRRVHVVRQPPAHRPVRVARVEHVLLQQQPVVVHEERVGAPALGVGREPIQQQAPPDLHVHELPVPPLHHKVVRKALDPHVLDQQVLAPADHLDPHRLILAHLLPVPRRVLEVNPDDRHVIDRIIPKDHQPLGVARHHHRPRARPIRPEHRGLASRAARRRPVHRRRELIATLEQQPVGEAVAEEFLPGGDGSLGLEWAEARVLVVALRAADIDDPGVRAWGEGGPGDDGSPRSGGRRWI